MRGIRDTGHPGVRCTHATQHATSPGATPRTGDNKMSPFQLQFSNPKMELIFQKYWSAARLDVDLWPQAAYAVLSIMWATQFGSRLQMAYSTSCDAIAAPGLHTLTPQHGQQAVCANNRQCQRFSKAVVLHASLYSALHISMLLLARLRKEYYRQHGMVLKVCAWVCMVWGMPGKELLVCSCPAPGITCLHHQPGFFIVWLIMYHSALITVLAHVPLPWTTACCALHWLLTLLSRSLQGTWSMWYLLVGQLVCELVLPIVMFYFLEKRARLRFLKSDVFAAYASNGKLCPEQEWAPDAEPSGAEASCLKELARVFRLLLPTAAATAAATAAEANVFGNCMGACAEIECDGSLLPEWACCGYEGNGVGSFVPVAAPRDEAVQKQETRGGRQVRRLCAVPCCDKHGKEGHGSRRAPSPNAAAPVYLLSRNGQDVSGTGQGSGGGSSGHRSSTHDKACEKGKNSSCCREFEELRNTRMAGGLDGMSPLCTDDTGDHCQEELEIGDDPGNQCQEELEVGDDTGNHCQEELEVGDDVGNYCQEELEVGDDVMQSGVVVRAGNNGDWFKAGIFEGNAVDDEVGVVVGECCEDCTCTVYFDTDEESDPAVARGEGLASRDSDYADGTVFIAQEEIGLKDNEDTDNSAQGECGVADFEDLQDCNGKIGNCGREPDMFDWRVRHNMVDDRMGNRDMVGDDRMGNYNMLGDDRMCCYNTIGDDRMGNQSSEMYQSGLHAASSHFLPVATLEHTPIDPPADTVPFHASPEPCRLPDLAALPESGVGLPHPHALPALARGVKPESGMGLPHPHVLPALGRCVKPESGVGLPDPHVLPEPGVLSDLVVMPESGVGPPDPGVLPDSGAAPDPGSLPDCELLNLGVLPHSGGQPCAGVLPHPGGPPPPGVLPHPGDPSTLGVLPLAGGQPHPGSLPHLGGPLHPGVLFHRDVLPQPGVLPHSGLRPPRHQLLQKVRHIVAAGYQCGLAVPSKLYTSPVNHNIANIKLVQQSGVGPEFTDQDLQHVMRESMKTMLERERKKVMLTLVSYPGCRRFGVHVTHVDAGAEAAEMEGEGEAPDGADGHGHGADSPTGVGTGAAFEGLVGVDTLQELLPDHVVAVAVDVSAEGGIGAVQAVPRPVVLLVPNSGSGWRMGRDEHVAVAAAQWHMSRLVLTLHGAVQHGLVPGQRSGESSGCAGVESELSSLRVVVSLPDSTVPLVDQTWSAAQVRELPVDEAGNLHLLVSGLAAARLDVAAAQSGIPLLMVSLLRQAPKPSHSRTGHPGHLPDQLLSSLCVLLMPTAAACNEVTNLFDHMVQCCNGDATTAYHQHFYQLAWDIATALSPTAIAASISLLTLQAYASNLLQLLVYLQQQRLVTCLDLLLSQLCRCNVGGLLPAVIQCCDECLGPNTLAALLSAGIVGPSNQGCAMTAPVTVSDSNSCSRVGLTECQTRSSVPSHLGSAGNSHGNQAQLQQFRSELQPRVTAAACGGASSSGGVGQDPLSCQYGSFAGAQSMSSDDADHSRTQASNLDGRVLAAASSNGGRRPSMEVPCAGPDRGNVGAQGRPGSSSSSSESDPTRVVAEQEGGSTPTTVDAEGVVGSESNPAEVDAKETMERASTLTKVSAEDTVAVHGWHKPHVALDPGMDRFLQVENKEAIPTEDGRFSDARVSSPLLSSPPQTTGSCTSDLKGTHALTGHHGSSPATTFTKVAQKEETSSSSLPADSAAHSPKLGAVAQDAGEGLAARISKALLQWPRVDIKHQDGWLVVLHSIGFIPLLVHLLVLDIFEDDATRVAVTAVKLVNVLIACTAYAIMLAAAHFPKLHWLRARRSPVMTCVHMSQACFLWLCSLHPVLNVAVVEVNSAYLESLVMTLVYRHMLVPWFTRVDGLWGVLYYGTFLVLDVMFGTKDSLRTALGVYMPDAWCHVVKAGLCTASVAWAGYLNRS